MNAFIDSVLLLTRSVLVFTASWETKTFVVLYSAQTKYILKFGTKYRHSSLYKMEETLIHAVIHVILIFSENSLPSHLKLLSEWSAPQEVQNVSILGLGLNKTSTGR